MEENLTKPLQYQRFCGIFLNEMSRIDYFTHYIQNKGMLQDRKWT